MIKWILNHLQILRGSCSAVSTLMFCKEILVLVGKFLTRSTRITYFLLRPRLLRLGFQHLHRADRQTWAINFVQFVCFYFSKTYLLKFYFSAEFAVFRLMPGDCFRNVASIQNIVRKWKNPGDLQKGCQIIRIFLEISETEYQMNSLFLFSSNVIRIIAK